jgi:hypothetical protein
MPLTLIAAFVLGFYAKALIAQLSNLSERLARPLPETILYPLALPSDLPEWAKAGTYLIRVQGGMVSQELSPLARFLLGEAGAIPLRPATIITPRPRVKGRFVQPIRERVARLSDVEVFSFGIGQLAQTFAGEELNYA